MTDLPPTRQSLLIQLGKRSDLAWSEFLDVYEQAIVRYCISRGLQEADALDAAQEVYAAISQKMATWDPGHQGSFRAWLFRVARNISVDLIAARARLAAGGQADEQFLRDINDHRDSNPSGLLAEASTEFQLQWRRALFDWASRRAQQEVNPVTWQAFRLTAIEGRKAEDVAAELGIAIGSVYTAKCRVMARIRSHVDEWKSESPPDNDRDAADASIPTTKRHPGGDP